MTRFKNIYCLLFLFHQLCIFNGNPALFRVFNFSVLYLPYTFPHILSVYRFFIFEIVFMKPVFSLLDLSFFFLKFSLSSSRMIIFSYPFFVFYFEQRKNSKPFFDLLFLELLFYSIHLIV